jgi:hypothetical protein
MTCSLPFPATRSKHTDFARVSQRLEKTYVKPTGMDPGARKSAARRDTRIDHQSVGEQDGALA